MKVTTKKALTGIIAAAMVSSCAGIVSSAAEESNAITVSYSLVEESFTAANGVTIPAGTTVVGISIQNNTGFNTSNIMLDMNGANLLTDSQGNPIVSAGGVYDDSFISCVQNGDTVSVSSVSLDTCQDNGSLAVLYLDNDSDISVESAEFADADEIKSSANENISAYSTRLQYMYGDMDHDMRITMQDAYLLLSAVSQNGAMLVSIANTNLSAYLPNCNVYDAELADCNGDNWIKNPDDQSLSDVYNILHYSSTVSVGSPSNLPGWYVGERITYVIN